MELEAAWCHGAGGGVGLLPGHGAVRRGCVCREDWRNVGGLCVGLGYI